MGDKKERKMYIEFKKRRFYLLIFYDFVKNFIIGSMLVISI